MAAMMIMLMMTMHIIIAVSINIVVASKVAYLDKYSSHQEEVEEAAMIWIAKAIVSLVYFLVMITAEMLDLL